MISLGKAAAKRRKWDYEADVVVIGYGGAGACAAIAAHDAGVQALILEKAPQSLPGGNTGCSGGASAISSDVENAIKYYRALTQGTLDEESLSAFAEAMVGLPHKLEEWGAVLENLPMEPDYPTYPGADSFRRVRLASTEIDPRTGEISIRRGKALFEFLDSQVKKRKIKVMCETPGKELVQDPRTKEILGVRAESSAGEIYIKARRGVLLSCGGFQANREMLDNFLAYTWKLPIYPYGTPYNTGDGILMATEVGAKLWHLTSVEWGNFAPKIPAEKFGVGYRLVRQLPANSEAIYVNRQGKRFMNEFLTASHRRDLPQAQYWDHDLGGFPNIPFYLVFDETYRKKRPIIGHSGWMYDHKVYDWSNDNSAEIELGWIIKGNTIKELAKKVGIDSDGLAETIRKYNGYCRRGEDAEFGRPKENMAPVETPPYYATELCEPVVNTQGGPKRNVRGQVLDTDDKPIPRLYGAGELGSFFFPLYQTTSNIPEALVSGRIAGENAAALTPWG